jgi:hypothetical protein
MEQQLIKLGLIIRQAMFDYTRKNDAVFDESDLGGGCAVASGLLVVQAKRKLNIPLRFVATDYHAWTEYNDKIVDLTATQFSCKEEVLVLPKQELDKMGSRLRSWYQGRTNTIRQVNRQWPPVQRPANYKLVWLNPRQARLAWVNRML